MAELGSKSRHTTLTTNAVLPRSKAVWTTGLGPWPAAIRGSQKWDSKMRIKSPRPIFFFFFALLFQVSFGWSPFSTCLLGQPCTANCLSWYTPVLLAWRFTPLHPRETQSNQKASLGRHPFLRPSWETCHLNSCRDTALPSCSRPLLSDYLKIN